MMPPNLPGVSESDPQCGEDKNASYSFELDNSACTMSAFPEETLDQFNFPEIVKGSSQADYATSGKEFAPPGSPLPRHAPVSATGTGRCGPPGMRQGASAKSAHRMLPGGRASLAFGPRVPGSPRMPNTKAGDKGPRRSYNLAALQEHKRQVLCKGTLIPLMAR